MTRAVRTATIVAAAALLALTLAALAATAPGEAGTVGVAASTTSHGCHEAPLQDARHGAALPANARAAPDTASAATTPVTHADRAAAPPSALPTAAAARGLPRPAGPPGVRCAPPTLQVFRI